MKKLFVLVLLMAFGTLSAALANANFSGSTTPCTTIMLRHTTADYIITVLNTPQDDTHTKLLPKGISTIKPGENNRALIVSGMPVPIERLMGIVQKLDVPPQQISITAEVYEVDSTVLQTELKDLKVKVSAPISADNLSGLKKRLTDAGATLANAPVISTVSNTQAQMNIFSAPANDPAKAEPKPDVKAQFSMTVIPRVNIDKTITLTANAEIPYTETITTVTNTQTSTKKAERKYRVQFECKMLNGESVISWLAPARSANSSATGKQALIIFTPTIIEPAGQAQP